MIPVRIKSILVKTVLGARSIVHNSRPSVTPSLHESLSPNAKLPKVQSKNHDPPTQEKPQSTPRCDLHAGGDIADVRKGIKGPGGQALPPHNTVNNKRLLVQVDWGFKQGKTQPKTVGKNQDRPERAEREVIAQTLPSLRTMALLRQAPSSAARHCLLPPWAVAAQGRRSVPPSSRSQVHGTASHTPASAYRSTCSALL